MSVNEVHKTYEWYMHCTKCFIPKYCNNSNHCKECTDKIIGEQKPRRRW